MGLSLCGLGSRETTHNKPLCGKLHIFKASFASRWEKAPVSLFHMHFPTPQNVGKQRESLVPWLRPLLRERSAEKFKGAEKPKQLRDQAKPKWGLISRREWGIVRGKEKKGGRWLETKKVLGGELLCLAPLHQPSPPQACRAGEGSAGLLAPWDTKAWSGRGTASPLLHPWTPCHPLAPALWTGVVPVQTTLGKSRRSDPSGNRRASGMLLRSPWSSRRERQKQQVDAAGRSWVTGLQAAKDRHRKEPKLNCPRTQDCKAATSPRSNSSLRLYPP